MRKYDYSRLTQIGVSSEDAIALRRIAMTLHRWHELECGTGNDHVSECIVRGRKDNGAFVYDEDTGTPWLERHYHRKLDPSPSYVPIADREKSAQKLLAKIMARYPALRAYIQTDPRGAPLYILESKDIEGKDVSSCYNRGIAVHQ